MRKLLDKLAMWWLKPEVEITGRWITSGEITVRNCNLVLSDQISFIDGTVDYCTTGCRTKKCARHNLRRKRATQ